MQLRKVSRAFPRITMHAKYLVDQHELLPAVAGTNPNAATDFIATATSSYHSGGSWSGIIFGLCLSVNPPGNLNRGSDSGKTDGQIALTRQR